MTNKQLATYLNDHLAGSSTGLEMIEHLRDAYTGTKISEIAQTLHTEVSEDRKQLESLMEKLKISQSVPRKTSAWLGEKLVRVKLYLDDPSTGALHLLECTEAISLGVEGKRLLWRALAAASEATPELRELNYDRLIDRAESQRQQLEEIRLQAARGTVLK